MQKIRIEKKEPNHFQNESNESSELSPSSIENSNYWPVLSNQESEKTLKSSKSLNQKSENLISFEENDSLVNDWSLEENDSLFRLFEKWGSRWTKISHEIKGKEIFFLNRSENCVKNRFYGSLRKALRKMNRAVKNLTKKFKKEVKYESITRIIDASEGLFRLQSPLKEQSETLSQKILSLAQRTEDDMPSSEAEELIVEINKFNMSTRSYKSKKKIKNPINSLKKESGVIFVKKYSQSGFSKSINKKFLESDGSEGLENLPESEVNMKKSSALLNDAKIEIETPDRGDEDLKFFDDDFIERNHHEEIFSEIFTEVHSPLECELWI